MEKINTGKIFCKVKTGSNNPFVLTVFLPLLFFIFAPSKAMAAPEPQVSIQVPDAPFIGENFSIELMFDNTDASDAGYGPFIDVVLPVNGADGVAGTQEADGIDVTGDATYLGVSVTTVTQTFPNDGGGTGCVQHPFAVDTTGNPLQVCGTAGDKLVTIQLPFGSFVPDQPPAAIELPVSISQKADLNHGMDIKARAGFQFGATPVDDHATDPTILSDSATDSSSWTSSSTVTPTLIRLEKNYVGPEDETATGPNFPRLYRIEVQLAPGQTITNLDITDDLPNNMTFLEVNATSPSGGTVISSPPVNNPASPPNNVLDVQFSSVTADSDPDSTDAYVVFKYFIPLQDADSNNVIDPQSGDDVNSTNQAQAIGDWTPLDSRDPSGQDNAVADAQGPEHILADKSIAIQKGVAIAVDVGASGYSPGDVVEYTLDFQVSDYFSMDDVNVTDIVSDGQDFDTSFTPHLVTNVHGTSSDVTITPDHDTNADGTETLVFHLSNKLSGGCVPDSGTGGGQPDCDQYNQGPTTGRIVFRTIVKQNFDVNYPSGDESVDQGDLLDNNVRIIGNLLSVADNSSPTGQQEADTSAVSFNILHGEVSKNIYAINGSTDLPSPLIMRPGDTVTYRIRYSMPTNDVEDLEFTDYLPLPVLDATEIQTFDDVSNDIVPVAGHAKFGPDDTFHNIYDDGSGHDYPSITTSGPENSIRFIYGDFDDNDTAERTIDLLFTVTVNDDPFADGLYLTNQVRANDGSTNAGASFSDGIIQIELGEPVLEITKGVSQSNNPNAVISPPPSNLPVDGDATNSDANDTVTFVITVENTGQAPAYNVGIYDDTNQDMDDCSLVSVQDGSGTDLGYSGNLWNGGIALNDPIDQNGTAIGTFTCRIKEDARPTDVIDRQAQVEWAAGDGGDLYPRKSDNATVSMAPPFMNKSISSVVPGPISPNMTIGDNVTYRVDVTLPEGEIPNLTLADTLPDGLEYISDTLVVNTTGFGGSLASSTVTVNGQTVTVDMGNATVDADNDVSNNSFNITFKARVLDDMTNSATTQLQQKPNTVSLTYDGLSQSITDMASNFLGEPYLQVTKTISPSRADAGDEVTIGISVDNTGTSPAFDISVTDVLDGRVFDVNSVSEGTTPAHFTFSYSSPTVTYSSDSGFALYPLDNPLQFSFITYVIQDIVTSTPYENTANATYSSEDGDVEGERGESGNDTATIQIATVSSQKTLVSTSEPATSGSANPVAIGETATFDVTFTIPEGETKEVTVFDLLENVSGTPWGEYVERSAMIMKTSSALSCIGSICTDSLNGAAANDWVNADSYVQVSDTANGRRISVDLGNVTNSNNDNNALESYVLRVTVVVLNNNVTNGGTNLPDRGGLVYQDASGTSYTLVSNNVDLLATEPVPQIQKTASPTTASAGDEITFTLHICNSASGDSAAAGFDWTFSDTLPDRYEAISSVHVDAGSTGATVTTSHSGRHISEKIDRLDPGECVDVTYTATLIDSVQYAEQITNTASVNATSLPGNHGTGSATPGNPGDTNGERTGGGGINDLHASSSATVTIEQPTLTKDMLNHKNWYAIGDNATFVITAGLPKGTSKNFVITDHIPSGLELESASLNVSLPSGASSTNAPLDESNSAFFSYDSSNGVMTLDFGNVTVPTAGNVAITYQTVVRNIMANQDGTQLLNTVELSYDDPSNPGNSLTVGPVDNQQQVHVGEPNLEMTKVITSGATDVDAGDTVSWQVSIQNTGHTTAYHVNWQDALPDGLFNISNAHVTVSGSVFLNGTSTPVSDSSVQITTTLNTNDTISLPLFQIGPGASITVTFDSVLMDSVVPGQVLDNQTNASYTSLVNGNGRDNSSGPGTVDDDNDAQLNNYEESAGQSLTVGTSVTIDKQVDKNQVTVGDTVTFTIRASIQEGTIPGLTIHDVLPTGFGYVSHQVLVGNSGITFSNPNYDQNVGFGQEVMIDLGDVANPADGRTGDDYVEVEIVAKAMNISSNQAGTVLRNGQESEGSNVYLTFSQGGGTTRVDFDHDPATPGIQGIPVEIVEPDLSITKTAQPDHQSLGDMVTFTVQVSHTGQSTSDAQDVVIQDQIPAGMSFVDSSLPVSDVSVNGQQVEFRIHSLTLSQGQTSFTYRARVDLDATVDQPLTNSMHLTWKSLSRATGAADSGRTGHDCPPGLNDYCDDASSTVMPTANAAVDAQKTVSIADDADASGDVSSGDTLEYTITITNGSSPVTGTIFTDVIPENTTYVPGSMTLDSASLTDAADGDDGDYGHNVPDGVSVRIGDMAAGQSVTVTFRVRINDYTPAGVVISNQGVVDTDQSVPEPTDADGVDENGDQPTDIPVGGTATSNLRAEKEVNLTNDSVAPQDGTINVGDEITYTIRLLNTGSSELHNVNFSDEIPSGVEITSVTNGDWTPPSQNVTSHFDSIPAGSTRIITITAIAGVPGTMTNQGVVTTDETPEVLTDGNPDPADGEQPTTFAVAPSGSTGSPALGITKQVQLIDDTNNDGLLNPGESFRYALVLSNTGSAAAEGVVLSDPVPAHVSLVSGSIHTSQGAMVSESPVEINIGTVPAGDSVTASFDVIVDQNAGAGLVISNQAVLTDSSGTSTVSDDPGTDDGTDCSSAAKNCGDGITGNDDPTNVMVSAPQVFDPPSAEKTGIYEGNSVITWRQVWINSGNAQANRVRVIDPIPENTSYIAGTLSCVPMGSSTTTRCQYDDTSNEIIWEGTISPDQGAADEEEAANEVIIVFQTRLENGVRSAENLTSGYWDADGDGFIDDDIENNQIAITSAAAVQMPVNVPLFSGPGAALLVLLIGMAGCIKRMTRSLG